MAMSWLKHLDIKAMKHRFCCFLALDAIDEKSSWT